MPKVAYVLLLSLSLVGTATTAFAGDSARQLAALESTLGTSNLHRAPMSRPAPAGHKVAVVCIEDYCSSDAHCCSHGDHQWCCLNNTTCSWNGNSGECY